MTDRRRSPLGVLFLTLFIDLMGFSIVFPLFPAMLDHYLGVEKPGSFLHGLREILQSITGEEPGSESPYTAALFGGFLGSIYSALQFFFAPLWGSLSDRVGRRPVLLLSIAGTALSYLLWVFSGSFTLLLISRLLGGCMSGNISTATAAVADSTGRESRARGMGIIGAAFGLGFILGPAIGGISYALAGGATSRVSILKSFPGLASVGVNPFSAAALMAFLLTAINFLWVLTRFDETLSREDQERALSTTRPLHPLLLLVKLDIPGVQRTNLAYFLFLLAFSGVEFTMTFFAHDVFGYSVGQITVLFVFSGLIIAIVQGGLVRRVAPRFGERNVATVGLLTLLPGFFVFAFSHPHVWLLYLGLALMSVGTALAIPCMTSLVSLYTPTDRQGSVLGVFRSLGALSRAVGPAIFCSIYWKFGPTAPYVSGGVLLVVPVVLSALLVQPERCPAGEVGGASRPAPAGGTDGQASARPG